MKSKKVYTEEDIKAAIKLVLDDWHDNEGNVYYGKDDPVNRVVNRYFDKLPKPKNNEE